MKSVWETIAPPAMFTAAGNVALQGTEDFSTALDLTRWNNRAEDAIMNGYTDVAGNKVGASANGNYGFTGTSAIPANTFPGSNNKPVFTKNSAGDYNISGWEDSDSQIRVPAGFAPIRGNNVIYADSLPPFDCTMTFNDDCFIAA